MQDVLSQEEMQDVSYVKVLDTTSENEKKNGILCAYKLAHRMNV